MGECLVVDDRSSCGAAHRRVSDAIIDGEPVEELLVVMASLDGDGLARQVWGPVDGLVHRWVHVRHRYSTRDRRLPEHQVDKARRTVGPFVDRLEQLPERLDIAEVGTVDLMTDDLLNSVRSWSARLDDGGNLTPICQEVRLVMATLTRARMHLDLGALRLDV